jgi:hypothetical protein
MDVPQWVIQAVFVVVILWIVDREIGKFKKWVEELVGFARQKNVSGKKLEGICGVCGRLKAEDYADCPTCNRRFVDPGICGHKWNEIASKSGTPDLAGDSTRR